MAFSIPDLTVVAIIQEALEFLSRNPSHIEYILSMYCNYPQLKKNVGPEHIKQCIEYVTQNRIEVGAFYEMDRKKRPSVVVISGGSESEQFIGDYGNQEIIDEETLPYVYAEWDAKSISGDTMSVARTQGLQDKLWPGIYVINGDNQFILDGILVRDGNDTKLCFKEKLPEGISLKGWKASSSVSKKGYVLGASIDDITLQIKLTTNGDFAVHRLLSTILRYCIKSRRLSFDNYGIQVATFSYSPPVLSDSEEMEYESVFTITGKYADHWIEKEYDLPDKAANIVVSAIAHSDTKEDVEL